MKINKTHGMKGTRFYTIWQGMKRRCLKEYEPAYKYYGGRRIKSLRWYYPNLIPLCPLHHTFGTFSAHQSPMRMRKELVDIFGTKWEKDIFKQGAKTFKGTYQLVLDYFEGKTNNY